LRYSIPVFFTVAGTPAKLSWTLMQRANKPVIVATNSGDRRIRLSKLKVTDGKGGVANFGEGLAGYVLGHSSMDFVVPASAKGFGAGGLAANATAVSRRGSRTCRSFILP
jgi:fimbrial chaperone protein